MPPTAPAGAGGAPEPSDRDTAQPGRPGTDPGASLPAEEDEEAEAVIGPTGEEAGSTSTPTPATALSSEARPSSVPTATGELAVSEDTGGGGGLPTSTVVGLGMALVLGGGAGVTALRRRGGKR